jgi:phenylacetate-CoA ligase
MFFFRLYSMPGYRWPPLPDAVIAQAWNAYLELDRTQWLEPAELVQQQLIQVRALLTHCMSEVPYYRQAMLEAGLLPAAIQTLDDFRRLPILQRRTYQEKHQSFQAARLPPGTEPRQIARSSGSSGTPIAIPQTNMVDLWWHALFLRDLEWCRLDPTGTIAAIRWFDTSNPSWQQAFDGIMMSNWLPSLELLIHSGSSHVMDVRQDPRVQLQWLRQLNPDYLLSYSTNLEALAALVRREGQLPNLKAIQTIATTVTPEGQAEIEDAFGVPLKNTYSCTEAGYLASPCPDGHGLHVHAENVLMEVLDDDGQPCGPGQTGRVHITVLHNLRAPLVRYDLGDEATLGQERCPCGRGLPLLTQVQGKRYPMLRLPDGRLRHAIGLTIAVRRQGGHWQYQIVQKAVDHVVVRLATDPTWSPQHAEGIQKVVTDFFEAPVRVDIETHERLELPRNGKFQSVICELSG